MKTSKFILAAIVSFIMVTACHNLDHSFGVGMDRVVNPAVAEKMGVDVESVEMTDITLLEQKALERYFKWEAKEKNSGRVFIIEVDKNLNVVVSEK